MTEFNKSNGDAFSDWARHFEFTGFHRENFDSSFFDDLRDNVKGPGHFSDTEERESIDPQSAITMAPSYPAGALVLLHNLPSDVPPALIGATVKVGARVFRNRERWEQQILGSNSEVFLNVMRELQNRGTVPCWPVSMMFMGTVSAPVLPIWSVWNK